jgi:hypothetical protein
VAAPPQPRPPLVPAQDPEEHGALVVMSLLHADENAPPPGAIGKLRLFGGEKTALLTKSSAPAAPTGRRPLTDVTAMFEQKARQGHGGTGGHGRGLRCGGGATCRTGSLRVNVAPSKQPPLNPSSAHVALLPLAAPGARGRALGASGLCRRWTGAERGWSLVVEGHRHPRGFIALDGPPLK